MESCTGWVSFFKKQSVVVVSVIYQILLYIFRDELNAFARASFFYENYLNYTFCTFSKTIVYNTLYYMVEVKVKVYLC